jgi:UDP-3-O-[3-hydroxymyristoyl] glucosamine N-acyltransferase
MTQSTQPRRAVQQITLAELAEELDATLVGDGSFVVTQLVHPRLSRSPQDLVYAVDPEALAAFPHIPAQAAVISEGMAVPDGLLKGYLIPKRPRYALAILLDVFDKPVHAEPGVHPSAVVHPSAQLGKNVSVGPLVYVGEGARVGDETILMPHVTVGAQAQIGQKCLLHPGVRVGERVVLGNRVIANHNASIGGDGFSFVTPEAGSIETARATGGTIEAQNTEIVRINSNGTVVIEDDVEIGSCATIDRATLGATLIKKGTKIDNLVMVAHNSTVGENCLIVSQVGIAGSCKIGNRVVLAGQAGIKDHAKIGDDAIVMAQAGVIWDVEPKSLVIGSPAQPQREFFQQVSYLGKLKEMNKELKALKNRLAQLETAQQETVGASS